MRIADLTHEVGLEERRQTVRAVLRRVEIHIVALLARIDLLEIVVRLVAIEAVEVQRLIVGDGQRGRESHARNPKTVVVRNHIQLRALREERGLEVPLLARVGVCRAVAKVVDIEQGTQLEALIGIECDGGQGTKVVARLDNLLLCGSYILISLGTLRRYHLQRTDQRHHCYDYSFH